MHFEVPKSKKLKEFGGEYVMIVISILAALKSLPKADAALASAH